MRVQQRSWTLTNGWDHASTWSPSPAASLVLVFGPRELLAHGEPIHDVHQAFPNAQVVGCSTAGEISGTTVSDGSLIFTAVEFDSTRVRVADTDLTRAGSSRTAGEQLADALAADDLIHALVLSDGLHVNGSELVDGLVGRLPAHVAVTGGLAGDGALFTQTLVHMNGNCGSNHIVGIGLYGDRLRVGYGSLGGWDPFGPERLVTRSRGNVLYELDGESALALYERYLGEHASGLPASALRFPLSIRSGMNDTPIVRTILGIDKKEQSMTFAGDITQGMHARLMRADVDRLIDGASSAARVAQTSLFDAPAELAILISCVGRKLVLRQRTEEEVEAVQTVLGPAATLAGFYSYGEICPFGPRGRSTLHNQTMTVTTFSEAA